MNTPATPRTSALGKLYLVPAPLDFGCDQATDLQASMPLGTLQQAASLSHWVCENAKTARAYLKRIHDITPLCQPIQAMSLVELPREVHKKGDHQGQFDARGLLAPALQGHDLGLISEAGMPAIADPGASVVRAAHDAGLQVCPLVGPVSLLLALAASGLNGQNFAFVGYLPQDAQERCARLRDLEALALKTGQTQLFIETPYRNAVMLAALKHTLQPHTRLAISSGLTMAQASIISHPVKHWKQSTAVLDNAIPAVFAIGR
ncbi:SAM-dependent methyltransferase [Rhodoferax sp.]|uniref:SAM-dependent methyltransferase n=1 Tax=Rhodoferax sp. TaxID=50421 RepID=UPI002601BEE8|nr:SAM-dependent methyltransferase [Rhodoferax sp.]MDD5479753.1 SAM-dependent methyltransferase [Rhodoferax sp.]